MSDAPTGATPPPPAGPPPKPERTFATNAFELAAASAVAQGLGILAAPILTRLFGPTAFGIAEFFLAVTTVVAVIACLRYELAIVLPKDEREAANVLAASLLALAGVSVLTGIAVWLTRGAIERATGMHGLGNYLLLAPVAVLLFGGVQALSFWNTRTKQFRRAAASKLISSGGAASARVTLGLVGMATAGGLIIGALLGALAGAATLTWQTLRDSGKAFREHVSPAGIWAAMKRYRRFPAYNTPGTLFNQASADTPVYILAVFFSPAVVGLYALGNRTVRTPMVIVGNAIAQVFFQRTAEAKHQGQLASVVSEVYDRLVVFGLFPTAFLILIGDDLFAVVFGEAWTEAGVYVQILAPFIFVWFVSAPLSNLFSVLEMQRAGVVLQATILATRVVALVVGGLLGDARLALVLFTVSGVATYGWMSLWILHMAGVPMRRGLRIFPSAFAPYIPTVIILAVAKYAVGVDHLPILAIAMLAASVHAVIIIKGDPLLRRAVLARFPAASKVLR